MAFPTSPTNGQQTTINGVIYTYSTALTAWTVTSSGGSLIASTAVSATGNITGGNLLTGGTVSATGNVTGNYILGNGSQLTGIAASGSGASISNGTSNVTVVSSGGNVSVGVGGTGNVAVFATTGEYITGLLSVTGNVTGNYILGNGSQLTGITASGSGASISNGTSNVTVVSSGGNVTVGVGGTGNVAVFATTGEYITGLLSVTGNVTGNYLIGNVVAGTGSGGNITGANLITAVTVSASGNISDGLGFLRNIPINTQTANYTLTVNDTGKFISSNTTVNVPPSIFSAGNVMTVYNNSAVSITVVAITGVTLQLAGSATVGNRTLAQRGVGTVLCVAANTFVMYGTGVT